MKATNNTFYKNKTINILQLSVTALKPKKIHLNNMGRQIPLVLDDVILCKMSFITRLYNLFSKES